MTKKYMIMDCYVDEPASLGVPPFISPYPRYLNGALLDSGISPEYIKYFTIDDMRDSNYLIGGSYNMIFLIGGAVVPGKYLGAKIGTIHEIKKIINNNSGQKFAIGGLISRQIDQKFSNVILINKDIEKYAYLHVKGNPEDDFRSTEEIARWSVLGAGVVKYHKNYPNIICEIETSRGCPRAVHCSFCSEGLFEKIDFRDTADILNEIDSLISAGVSRYRLGRQADILQYKSDFSVSKNGFPKPEVSPIKNLFFELKNKKLRNEIKTLNIDNGNPGTIVNYPDESIKILEAITEAITPGDTLALGIESFDPEVIKSNNLKVSGNDAVIAIKIINEIGNKRVNGLPVLLPGLNLIHGLSGESKDTFKINYEYLLKIKNSGLLLKRINIRKLLPFPGTPIYKKVPVITKKVLNRFEFYKNEIRNNIDNYMLKQIYPVGTVLMDSLVLDKRADYSFGKQIASYSITSKYPEKLEINKFYNSIVIGHRERSLISLTLPININKLPGKAFELIPGIGKKSAAAIILKRPFDRIEEFKELLIQKGIKLDEKIISAITFK